MRTCKSASASWCKHEEYLGAESCLVVEDALDKITKLLGRDLALAADSDAARVSDHLQIIMIICHHH